MLARLEPRLVPVLPRLPGRPTAELWAVMHSDLRRSARVLALLAWLVEVLA
jgi:DNA-binding transcriptional LysR family regulator